LAAFAVVVERKDGQRVTWQGTGYSPGSHPIPFGFLLFVGVGVFGFVVVGVGIVEEEGGDVAVVL
jgi:hypothetical protein